MRSVLQPRPAERGQTVIEFALLAPVIFLLLFLIVDFGIALDRRIVIQHAVREGARAAAVQADPAGALDATVDQAQGLVDPAAVTVCFVDKNLDGLANALEPVKVSLTYDYYYTVPFGSLLGAFGVPYDVKITMTPSATSALENDPPSGVTFTECPP